MRRTRKPLLRAESAAQWPAKRILRSRSPARMMDKNLARSTPVASRQVRHSKRCALRGGYSALARRTRCLRLGFAGRLLLLLRWQDGQSQRIAQFHHFVHQNFDIIDSCDLEFYLGKNSDVGGMHGNIWQSKFHFALA